MWQIRRDNDLRTYIKSLVIQRERERERERERTLILCFVLSINSLGETEMASLLLLYSC